MFRGLLAVIFMEILAGPALAQSEACMQLRPEYENAQSKAIEVAQKYFDCVRKFDPFNDCDAEFQQLRSAHEAFRDTVGELQDLCR